MKTLLVVLDGAADRPHPVLRGRTPLEAARTPNLDWFARQGVLGLAHTAPPGVAPESDEAVLALLGYSLHKHMGRGPLEAAGLGYRPSARHFLALRANFATLGEDGNILDRRAGRSLKAGEASALARALTTVSRRGFSVRVLPGVSHRAVVVFESDRPFSARITNTDPAYRVMRTGAVTAVRHYKPILQTCKPLERTPSALQSAELVNEFSLHSFFLLNKHPVNEARRRRGEPPANLLLLRDAGTRFPLLATRRGWAIVADMPLEVGIGRLAGMRIVRTPPPGFTARDYPDRARRAIAALRKHRAVYVHLKGPDLYGHEGDARGKTRSLAEIDAGFFRTLREQIDLSKVRIIVTADHATPCSFKTHGSDPVPFLVLGGVRPDEAGRFTEREARKGGGGRLDGARLLARWGGR